MQMGGLHISTDIPGQTSLSLQRTGHGGKDTAPWNRGLGAFVCQWFLIAQTSVSRYWG